MLGTSRHAIPGVRGIVPPSASRRIASALCCILMSIGSVLLIWVWAEPQVNAWIAQNQVSEMTSSDVDLDNPKRLSELEQARRYNEALAADPTAYGVMAHRAEIDPYVNQLDWPNGNAMAGIEIPAINVKLPIYHYDTDESLMQGLGHVEGTSLPVGGASSHTVITGHSGMPGKYMFDDLDELDVGDEFVIWTLSEPYAYRVDNVEVVGPDDTSSFGVVRGHDRATLVTCTPYRINTHRLLVHAERCEYVPAQMLAVSGEKVPLHYERLLPLIAGAIAMAIMPFVWMYIAFGARRWGERRSGMLRFGYGHHILITAAGDTSHGRWHCDRHDGRVTITFDEVALKRVCDNMHLAGLAFGGELEAVGDMDEITLYNHITGAEVTLN